MLKADAIFKNKSPVPEKLAAYGFASSEGGFTLIRPILDGQFSMTVTVKDSDTPRVKVFDSESGDEYVLVHSNGPVGGFTESVISACEEILRDTAEKCFITEIFRSPQTKFFLKNAENKYGSTPEFLWEKTPDCAVLRRADSGKWYAVVITVKRCRLGLPGDGTVEITDLRGTPENVSRLIGAGHAGILPGYHMNKKHWYTVVLDGSIPDDKLAYLTEESYNLAKKQPSGRKKQV